MRAIARVVVLCSVTAAADTNFSSTPAEGAIVLVGGGARTFLCTFPDLLKRLVVPLDASRSPHPGADLYAFLKTSDPGAKQQEGHNFTYPDVDAATLREALYEYRNVVGVPGGKASPLVKDLMEATLKQGDKVDFAKGQGSDADMKSLVWIMDTASHPSFRAENYHQFHDGFARGENYPDAYNGLGAALKLADTSCPSF